MVVVGLGREARGYQFKLEPDSKMVHVATNFGVRNALGLHVRFSHKVPYLCRGWYRSVSGVFQNIPPTPFSPSECVLPPHQRRGGGTHWLGVGCQYFGRRQTLD
jgi:hypothetical protein